MGKYILRRLDQAGREHVIPLTGRTVIGREDVDVLISGDRYVSGRHAEVELVGDQVILRDLDSRNGTYLRLNGELELRHGDVIAIGRQLLRYLE